MQLFQKIQTGQVESVHLHKAIPLLHLPEVCRENVESYCTYHWLWSDPAAGEDTFRGLTVQGYTLKARRSPVVRPGSFFVRSLCRWQIIIERANIPAVSR